MPIRMPRRRFWAGLARRLALYYLLILLAMTFIERWLVYPAPGAHEGDWAPPHLEFEDAHFASADGTPLHGWFFAHPSPRRTVLYLHGNGVHVADIGDLMPVIANHLQADVLVFDYRGYGKSGGKPIEPRVIEDGLAASAWLAERTGSPVGRQVLIGRSIGAGVAVAMAERQGAGAVVAQCAFARLTDPAADAFPWLPVRLLMRNRYPSVDRIQNYPGPLFSCHGTEDRVVAFEQGRQLFEAAPTDQKRFLTFEGMGHNEPLPRAYWQELAAFLDEVGA